MDPLLQSELDRLRSIGIDANEQAAVAGLLSLQYSDPVVTVPGRDDISEAVSPNREEAGSSNPVGDGSAHISRGSVGCEADLGGGFQSNIESVPITTEAVVSSHPPQESIASNGNPSLPQESVNLEIPPVGESRIDWSQADMKVVSRRRRVDPRVRSESPLAWLRQTPDRGYIKHPDAGWIKHPSRYSHSLCEYKKPCTHDPNCSDLRLEMAIETYSDHRSSIALRDVERLWGVSRSTISRVRQKSESNGIATTSRNED